MPSEKQLKYWKSIEGKGNPAKRKEVRKKISSKLKGRKQNKETVDKRRISMIGKNVGKKRSEETKRRMSKSVSISLIGKKGENSRGWKGDDIKIVTIHDRVKNKYGKPSYCEICKSTKKKRYDWSNKDHSYKMPINRDDWQRLCRGCHIKYDIENNNKSNNYQMKI